jgi:hypothetical protein
VVQTVANVVRIAALTKPLTARPLVANWFFVELMSPNPPQFFYFLKRPKTRLDLISDTRERWPVAQARIVETESPQQERNWREASESSFACKPRDDPSLDSTKREV